TRTKNDGRGSGDGEVSGEREAGQGILPPAEEVRRRTPRRITMNPCINPEQFQRFVAEQLSEAERGTMETHLSECIPCQQALQRLSQADPILDALILFAGRMAAPAEPLEPFLRALQDNPPPDVQGSTEPGDNGGATEFHFLDPPTDLGPLGRLD